MAGKLRTREQIVVQDEGWSDWCSTSTNECACEDDPCDCKTSLEEEDIIG